MRDLELQHSMDRRGHVTFRSGLPTGAFGHGFQAACDGQLGGAMKVYREWQVVGDDLWLKKRIRWRGAASSIVFAPGTRNKRAR